MALGCRADRMALATSKLPAILVGAVYSTGGDALSLTAPRRTSTMPKRRLPTLADAQRQARWRNALGSLLIGLSLLFLLLVLAKHVYFNPSRFFFPDFSPALHPFINPLLRDWPILALLWWAIPPWKPMPTVPTTAMWEYVNAVWGVLVVAGLGKWLRWTAYERRMEIRDYLRDRQHEAWREQDRAARGLPPDDRGPITVIQQGSWYEAPAPPESFSHTTLGSVVIGLIIALAGGVLLLWAEYAFFQPHWPSSRN
jgi:hypothetical protein